MSKHLIDKVQEALQLAKEVSKDGNFSLCSVARILARQGFEVTGGFHSGVLQDDQFTIDGVIFKFELEGEAYDPFSIFGNWKLTETTGE